MVAAAGDDDVSEAPECGPAGVPVDEGQQRMARPAGAVCLQRTHVATRCTLRFGERRLIGARGSCCGEERPVRLLRGMREVALEAVKQNRRSAFRDGKRVAPET